jgi:uncharacterized OsmC-like protein
MTIEASSADESYSPFHMLASSLATCTFSVLHSWASHAKLGSDDLAIVGSWVFAADPQRVGAIRMELEWPSLPENRRAAGGRVAEMCTIPTTLHHPPHVSIGTGEQHSTTRAEAAA